jgi:hypothetical protein
LSLAEFSNMLKYNEDVWEIFAAINPIFKFAQKFGQMDLSKVRGTLFKDRITG